MIFRVILLAIALAVSAGAFIVFKNELDNEIVLGILGVLAMVGIFFFVSAMIGFIEIMPQSRPDELARIFVDTQPEGTLVTDRKGRIVYANAAYGALTGAVRESDAQTLETLFSRDREASESIYRLTNGLHEGQNGAEEFRLHKALNPSAGADPVLHVQDLNSDEQTFVAGNDDCIPGAIASGSCVTVSAGLVTDVRIVVRPFGTNKGGTARMRITTPSAGAR